MNWPLVRFECPAGTSGGSRIGTKLFQLRHRHVTSPLARSAVCSTACWNSSSQPLAPRAVCLDRTCATSAIANCFARWGPHVPDAAIRGTSPFSHALNAPDNSTKFATACSSPGRPARSSMRSKTDVGVGSPSSSPNSSSPACAHHRECSSRCQAARSGCVNVASTPRRRWPCLLYTSDAADRAI